MKKRAFRTELLAELRELVAVGRRLAAMAEHERAKSDIESSTSIAERDSK